MDSLIFLNKLNQETPGVLHAVIYHGEFLYSIINGRIVIGADYYDFVDEVKTECSDYQFDTIIIENYV